MLNGRIVRPWLANGTVLRFRKMSSESKYSLVKVVRHSIYTVTDGLRRFRLKLQNGRSTCNKRLERYSLSLVHIPMRMVVFALEGQSTLMHYMSAPSN